MGTTAKESGDDFPNTPEELLSYISTQSSTENAHIRFQHLTMAGYLAGWDLSLVTRKTLDENVLVHLRKVKVRQLLEDARENIRRGNVSRTNWRADFEGFIDAIGAKGSDNVAFLRKERERRKK